MPSADDLYQSLLKTPNKKKLSPGAETMYRMSSAAIRNTRGKDGGVRNSGDDMLDSDKKILAQMDAIRNPPPERIKFTRSELEEAKKAGYSNNDINDFLKMEGIDVDHKYQGFEAAGLGTGKDGKQYLQWRLDANYEGNNANNPVNKPKNEKKTNDGQTTTILTDVPKSINKEAGTIGITTGSAPVVAEDPKVTAPAPILGDPLGDQSQRVVRESAKKTLTTV
jgi:hypothetical protein